MDGQGIAQPPEEPRQAAPAPRGGEVGGRGDLDHLETRLSESCLDGRGIVARPDEKGN